MCGIYGKLRFDGRDADARDAERAWAGLRHRGPDDRGAHVSGSACLAHTRLSIIDLSPLGRQPMTNEDGSLWIVFNGEIYNFRALTAELSAKGHVFRSGTDTETILHLYEQEGPSCVERLRGMFAFAIWDERQQTLFLARDRVGKKPLFYCRGRGFFAFSSELAPLVDDPEVPHDVDAIAIHHYLTFQSVPAPRSAFRAVQKLPPAHWMRVTAERDDVHRYWSLSFQPKFPADTARRRADLEDRLLATLDEAVQARLESDVPLGALLSGGLDSSGVVALMARASPTPVKTFSVGFAEREYDELSHARRVAERYGTEHHEVTVKPEMLSVLPLLVERFGEPFADPAAIPLYYITRVAREHVTVALCGDGGDESFAGYDRYVLNARLRRADVVPSSILEGAARLLRRVPHSSNPRSPVWIAKRLVASLALPPEVRNLRFLGHFDGEQKHALYTSEFAAAMADIDSDAVALARYRETDAEDFLDRTLHGDMRTYLADTLLPKVDVASMANSLEIRSPLLDHELMEFAARLPAAMKLRGMTTKYALKRALAPLLPAENVRRRKMGFGVPLDRWFRTDLRDLLHDTLLSRRAIDRGYFREPSVRRLLEEHETGRWRWQYHLYDLLVLELWHRRFIDR